MRSDFNIKPVGAPVAAPLVRPAPEAARAAVPTQLPAPQSVTAASTAVRTDLSANPGPEPASAEVSHQIVIDRAAAAIVYQLVDTKTRQVVNQYPEASRLRARAYLRAQDNAKLDDRRMATDRQV